MSLGSQASAFEAGLPELYVPFRPSLVTLGVCHLAFGDRWAGAKVHLPARLKRSPKMPRLSAIFVNEGSSVKETRQMAIDVCAFDESRQSFLRIIAGAEPFLTGQRRQVLHTHRDKEDLLAALHARRSHVPVHVSSEHGAPEPFQSWRGIKQSAMQALDRQMARHATDRMISVNVELRTQRVRKLPAHEIASIHNGIDEETVVSRFAAAAAKRGNWIAHAGAALVVKKFTSPHTAQQTTVLSVIE